jgi:hypothetical protein
LTTFAKEFLQILSGDNARVNVFHLKLALCQGACDQANSLLVRVDRLSIGNSRLDLKEFKISETYLLSWASVSKRSILLRNSLPGSSGLPSLVPQLVHLLLPTLVRLLVLLNEGLSVSLLVGFALLLLVLLGLLVLLKLALALLVYLVLRLLAGCRSLSTSTSKKTATTPSRQRGRSVSSTPLVGDLAKFFVPLDELIKTFHFSVHVYCGF